MKEIALMRLYWLETMNFVWLSTGFAYYTAKKN